jgi:hypothetical protein
VVYVHHWNIIMAKGKGRQSGGFASKAQKAQFHTELQERVTEDAAARRRRIPKPISVKERPKIRLQSLQYILRERQYDDQLEHKAIRQKNSLLSKRGNMSSPGRILYYRDHDYGKEFRTVDQSLQVICLKSLAQVLPNYLDAMGEPSLTQYLSLLPGPALAALSIYISNSIGMSNSMLRLSQSDPSHAIVNFCPQE